MFPAFSIIDVTEKRSLGARIFTIVFTKLIKNKSIMRENYRRVTYVIIFLLLKDNHSFLHRGHIYREH